MAAERITAASPVPYCVSGVGIGHPNPAFQLTTSRRSHFFVTPKAGGKVDENQVTQWGRALQELGIKMIPAYSPQAGRMERSYRTWQGRPLPPKHHAG
jgi:hypothetical protein